MIQKGETHQSKAEIIQSYKKVRSFTEHLCQPLEIEDYIIQSMPDVSPTRWHLAHTAWFFETFLLRPKLDGYTSPNDIYNYLFNSYYNAIGKQYPRAQRGHLSRPTVAQVYEYRRYVDQEMLVLMEGANEESLRSLAPLITLGLNHEQQHQELLLTDLKHVLFQNPMYPVYHRNERPKGENSIVPHKFLPFSGGQVELGFNSSGFAFDNESPRHHALLSPFNLGNRLITNGEYLSFIEDGGYTQAQLWLSDGWAIINQEAWKAPLYWVKQDGLWFEFTLSGLEAIRLDVPVTHLSYYEADAYANWANARLPSELEWEHVAQHEAVRGNFVENNNFHPTPLASTDTSKVHQLYGDAWEWTRSPYSPYPGFKAAKGAVGEYNGKFMSSQMVLRGGSCVSTTDHIRATYRNFFYPSSRWQFMGLRLANDL